MFLHNPRVLSVSAQSSAGTNVYLPHSKVLLIKRMNVRIICFFDFCITILLYDLLLYYHINHLHNNA